MAMRIVEPDGWATNIGLYNRRRTGDFRPAHRHFLQSMLPYLKTSLRLYASLQRSQSERRILEGSLDQLGIGVFIIDGGGRLLNVNRTGREIATNGAILSTTDGRLRLVKAQHDQRFQTMLSRAISAKETVRSVPFVAAARLEGPHSSFGVLVRSTESSDSFLDDTQPCAVVYVSDANAAGYNLESGLIAELFDLTKSEARLALLIARGETVQVAAKRLGLTVMSARTNLKRIFAKTGVSRQPELIRLILRSVAVLA